jgi:hypothetical protein
MWFGNEGVPAPSAQNASLEAVCLPTLHPLPANPENRFENGTDITLVCTDSPALNSYKFSKPRVYVKNDYPDSDINHYDRLKEVSLLVGSKARPESYNEYINTLLSISKSKEKRPSVK